MNNDPMEKYLELENNPYLWVRLVVINIKAQYQVEVDLIYKESHKIFKHIGIYYNFLSPEEAFISGVQKVRIFLDTISEVPSDEEKKNLH